MEGYDGSIAIEDRRLRKQLNEAWNDLDAMRVRLESEMAVNAQMRERIKALERMEEMGRALIIARDVLCAQQEQIERSARSESPEPEPVPLARELSVPTGRAMDT
jgi:hypothetical protein